mgnify:CR=1 FL=1
MDSEKLNNWLEKRIYSYKVNGIELWMGIPDESKIDGDDLILTHSFVYRLPKSGIRLGWHVTVRLPKMGRQDVRVMELLGGDGIERMTKIAESDREWIDYMLGGYPTDLDIAKLTAPTKENLVKIEFEDAYLIDKHNQRFVWMDANDVMNMWEDFKCMNLDAQ